MKKVFKSRGFWCLITALVVGTVSVSAATYFPSVDVTYDNKESGLVSTDVQGAIDELYGICSISQITGPATDILDKVNTVTSGDGLYKDEYEDGRYFYRGTNPNNYITFNNETAGWRIVSLEADGTIKILKNESIDVRAWNSTRNNNWARPATLNTYLNEDYYNDSLNETAKSQIVAKDWSIGAVTYQNNDLKDQINDENVIKWNGKVALATASEYIRSNSNKSKCATFSLNNGNYSMCKNTTWMYNNVDWWLLSADDGSLGYSNCSFNVFSRGIGYTEVTNGAGSSATPGYAVRPAVYLSSSVKLSGKGTLSEPYTIN